MGLIKKNLLLIVFILIFLAGMGIFAYGWTVFGKNDEKIQTVDRKYRKIKGLRSKLVANNVLANYERVANASKRSQEEFRNDIIATTDRPLIFDGVFPKPSGLTFDNLYQDFSGMYCDLVDGYLKTLNAGSRPSVVDEEAVRSKIDSTSSVGGGIRGLNSNAATNTGADIQVNELRKERSRKISIYANHNSFFAYEFWRNFQLDKNDTMLKNSWYTQIGHWIQEDVVHAIRDINYPSRSVAKSPVKRLIEISFGGPAFSGRPSVSDDKRKAEIVTRRVNNSVYMTPEYLRARASKAGASGKGSSGSYGQMTYAWTKRSSDKLVDVVHFEIAVVIDSTRINDFIDVLQSDKFTEDVSGNGEITKTNRRNQMTVLQIQLDPLNITEEEKGGFFYGPSSLKVLRVICEYTFYREGYDRYMPEMVKNELNPKKK